MARDRRGPGDTTAAPGTLAWWAARPEGRAAPRRGRPRRSFSEMVEVALDLIDELGADALNMRLLAERLETSTATLYRHVSGRDELVVYVVDRVLAEILEDGHDGDKPRDWREAVRRIAFRFRAILSRHPNVLPLLVSQLPVGPNALQAREQSLSALTSYGFSADLAARAYNAVAVYVIGFSAVQAAEAARAEGAALAEHYRGLDPESYPSTVAAAGALTSTTAPDEFATGLGFIIDGIDRTRRRRDRPASREEPGRREANDLGGDAGRRHPYRARHRERGDR